MNLRIVQKCNENLYDTLLVPFTSELQMLSKELGFIENQIEKILNKGYFRGNDKEVYCFSTFVNNKIKNIILLGLGVEENINNHNIFLNFSKVFSKCKEKQSTNILVLLDNLTEEVKDYYNLEKIFEAAWLVNDKNDKYKSYKAQDRVGIIDFNGLDKDKNKILNEAKICASGTLLARRLINEPPNEMTPAILGEEAKIVGKENGFKVTLYDELEIEKMGMNLFSAVGKGSINRPTLIVMEYFGDPDSSEKIGLIGKGVTFDTGGYSLKSEKSMENMQGDMGGAAAVIGAMKTISEMELKINVVSVIAACENRVSNDSYLPGDIIKTMSGKYVEINNTDSEGRLILADSITYITRVHKVDKIIDIATLTDAVQVALGNKTAGIFTNNKNLRESVNIASNISCEKIWELPFDEDLRGVLNSDFADFKNSGYGSEEGGGAIVAALFLKEFVEDVPWIHIDIGGTSWTSENLHYCLKGGMGFGTMLLYNLVKELSK